jgi:hypothetical protein
MPGPSNLRETFNIARALLFAPSTWLLGQAAEDPLASRAAKSVLLATFRCRAAIACRSQRRTQIALLDPLIQAFRQQRQLSAIGTLNEALHELPPGKSPSES